MADSLEIRDDLARALRLDLVGPDPEHPLESFLVPHEANEEWKSAHDGQEERPRRERSSSPLFQGGHTGLKVKLLAGARHPQGHAGGRINSRYTGVE